MKEQFNLQFGQQRDLSEIGRLNSVDGVVPQLTVSTQREKHINNDVELDLTV
jgi:hypothetical protein